MPKVTFIIDGEPQTVAFEHGKLPYSHHGKPESFLDVAKNLGVPLEHACGGSCACTTPHHHPRRGRTWRCRTTIDRLDTAWADRAIPSRLQSGTSPAVYTRNCSGRRRNSGKSGG